MQSTINTLLDPVVNFGKVTVSTGYTNDTVIVLITGHGSRLPNPSIDGAFNLTWYNASQYADPSDDPDVEIVRCTVNVLDVLTVTRGQESTSVSNKNTPLSTYKMILTPTKKTITDIKTEYQSGISAHSALSTGIHGVGADTVDSIGARNSAIGTHAGLTTTHGVTSAIVGKDDSQTLTNKSIYDTNSFVIGQGLRSASTIIYTASATAPSVDQVLTATSDSLAEWKNLSSIEGAVPTGTVLPYAGATAPTGYLICDGAAVSRTTYATLFLVTSTTYGTGNGSTTFNVPDLRGRTILGAGSGPGLTPRTRGNKAGSESHTHDISGNLPPTVSSGNYSLTWADHTPPFVALNYIIKT